MRKQYTGHLCVYRSGPLSGSLTATVTLDTGNEFYYWPCPKAFNDIVDPIYNRRDITFTADEHGNNPRGVKEVA